MFLEIELLYFVLMIALFVFLLLKAKLPSGLCMMAAAVVGVLVSAIFSGTGLGFFQLVEGAFGFFDTILVIAAAMVFMGAMQSSGALEYISAALVKAFRKVPSLLLVSLMLIIMFPAMVTGSSLASAISAGALVAPIMLKWGIPKAKTGAIIAAGSVLGMISPPINIPAMVICDVIDVPYANFMLPLFILTIPLAIVSVLLLGRKHVKSMSEEDAAKVVNVSVTKELNATVCIPLFTLIAFIIMEMIFPRIFGVLAMPAMFIICTVICFFVGRKLKFFRSFKLLAVPGEEEKPPESAIEVINQGVFKSLPAMGLLMGVGMFIEAISLNGVRGYFVTNAVSLPGIVKYIGMALSLPLFGGISAFGSASLLGGPFVMAFAGVHEVIVLICGLSMLAALGEFMPPTAMSATLAAKAVGEKGGWARVTKAALPAIAVIFCYTLLFTIGLSNMVEKAKLSLPSALLIGLAAAAVFVAVYEFICIKSAKKVCGDPGTPVEEAQQECPQEEAGGGSL